MRCVDFAVIDAGDAPWGTVRRVLVGRVRRLAADCDVRSCTLLLKRGKYAAVTNWSADQVLAHAADCGVPARVAVLATIAPSEHIAAHAAQQAAVAAAAQSLQYAAHA